MHCNLNQNGDVVITNSYGCVIVIAKQEAEELYKILKTKYDNNNFEDDLK